MQQLQCAFNMHVYIHHIPNFWNCTDRMYMTWAITTWQNLACVHHKCCSIPNEIHPDFNAHDSLYRQTEYSWLGQYLTPYESDMTFYWMFDCITWWMIQMSCNMATSISFHLTGNTEYTHWALSNPVTKRLTFSSFQCVIKTLSIWENLNNFSSQTNHSPSIRPCPIDNNSVEAKEYSLSNYTIAFPRELHIFQYERKATDD